MSRHHSKTGTSDRVDLGRPKPKFIGFAEVDTDLYEFHTSSGEYVYVHDMECIGIDFRPLTRQLLLTLQNSSSDLMALLRLVLTFEGAEAFHATSVTCEVTLLDR